MKSIKTTILILLAFIIGASATSIYASSQRLVMIPEYINGYSTVDLLQYVSTLKAKEDALTKQRSIKVIPKETTKKKTPPGVSSA